MRVPRNTRPLPSSNVPAAITSRLPFTGTCEAVRGTRAQTPRMVLRMHFTESMIAVSPNRFRERTNAPPRFKITRRIASVYLVRVRAVRNPKDEKADTAVCLPWALLRQQRVDCVGEREHRIGDIVEAHGRSGFHLHAICAYVGRPCGHQPSTKVSVVGEHFSLVARSAPPTRIELVSHQKAGGGVVELLVDDAPLVGSFQVIAAVTFEVSHLYDVHGLEIPQDAGRVIHVRVSFC